MSFLDLLPKRKSASEKIVRVRLLSDTQARPANELGLKHCAAGEILDFYETEANELVGYGCAERIGVVQSGKVNAAPPVSAKPEPAKPEPLPANFADLPKPFATAWTLIAQRRALSQDLEAAVDRALPPGWKAASKTPGGLGLYISVAYGDEENQKRLKQSAEVTAAEQRLRDHDRTKGPRFAEALLAAGQATIALTDKANAEARELGEIGFDLFEIRLAALELHRAKIHQLFVGSGLAQRYAMFTPLGIADTVFLGGENPDIAIDLPIASIASYYRNAAARLAEVEPLLKQARAELAAARGVTAKAKRAA